MASVTSGITLLSIANRTLDLTSGTLDCRLITAAPSNPTAIEDCALVPNVVVTGSQPTLTISSIAGITSGWKLNVTETSIAWSSLYVSSGTPSAWGFAISKRAGGAYAGTDPFIAALQFTTQTVISSTTSNNRLLITSSAAFGSVNVGDRVTGTYIPTGSVVVEKTDSSNIYINKPATGSGTNSLTFYTAATYSVATSSGAATTLNFTMPSDGILNCATL
jgi:hypothetical protein